MIIIDAQLSPDLAVWINATFGVQAKSLRDFGLRDAEDRQIFDEARKLDAILMTKNADFPVLLDHLGPPPKVLWITCGNTSNAHLKSVLQKSLRAALELLENGEPLVEISGA